MMKMVMMMKMTMTMTMTVIVVEVRAVAVIMVVTVRVSWGGYAAHRTRRVQVSGMKMTILMSMSPWKILAS